MLKVNLVSLQQILVKLSCPINFARESRILISMRRISLWPSRKRISSQHGLARFSRWLPLVLRWLHIHEHNEARRPRRPIPIHIYHASRGLIRRRFSQAWLCLCYSIHGPKSWLNRGIPHNLGPGQAQSFDSTRINRLRRAISEQRAFRIQHFLATLAWERSARTSGIEVLVPDLPRTIYSARLLPRSALRLCKCKGRRMRSWRRMLRWLATVSPLNYIYWCQSTPIARW